MIRTRPSGASDAPPYAPALTAWMVAQRPDDRLEGGAGDNILAGGLWSDSFVFAQGDGGRHRVLDLEAWDRVELQSFESPQSTSL